MGTRGLNVIAAEIKRDWKKVNYAARPYLQAMLDLETMGGKYFLDSARTIVTYFLANAGTWRGEVARRIKAELNQMLKG